MTICPSIALVSPTQRMQVMSRVLKFICYGDVKDGDFDDELARSDVLDELVRS